MRRSWLRGVVDVTKRYLLAVAAHNLGRILLKLWGIGKPKRLQGQGATASLLQLIQLLLQRWFAMAQERWVIAIRTRVFVAEIFGYLSCHSIKCH